MSVTEILIKAVGIVILLVGLSLLLTSVGAGILWSIIFISPIISFFTGLLLIAVGITIVRNGSLSL